MMTAAAKNGYRLASALIEPLPTNFIVHVGDTVAQKLSITNTAADLSENLIGNVVSESYGVTASGALGMVTAQGASDGILVDLPTTTAGTVSGSLTFDFQSDGIGIDAGGITDLGQQTVRVNATVNNYAKAAFEEVSGGGSWSQNGNNYTLDLGSLVQGSAPVTAELGVLNDVSGPADLLGGSFQTSGSSAFSLSGFGSFANLAAGQADAAPTVTLNTSNAGTFSETITLNAAGSNASGYSGALAPETLQVTGKVYRRASAVIGSLPANFIVHVGDKVTENLAITNAVANDGFSERLVGEVVGQTYQVTGAGALGTVAAQGTSNGVMVCLPTSTAGSVSGSLTFDFQSDGAGVDGAGLTELGQQTVMVHATVNNYAKAAFEEISGGGSWSQSGNNYTLNLGTIAEGTAPVTLELGVLNAAKGQADLLSGSFQTSGSSAFSVAGFGAFSSLASGQADTAPTVTLNTGTAGSFTETITLNSTGSNASGYSSALAPETLTITGVVQAAAPAPAPSPAPAPAPTPAPTGRVLTVGAGQEYASLSAAIAASQDGDTIQVQAGTYTDDFATINTKISIVGVGGMVHLVCDQPIPNDKGILIVNTDCTLQNIEFSGAQGPSGNDAGIRWQGGNLTLDNCYFHDNQDGLLGEGGTLTINNSEFANNGAGDGFTHNLYVGSGATALVVNNSYFYSAIAGHNIKSRALSTTVTNSVIADGATGTTSYSIDLPQGGNAVIQNNIIEKGPDSGNDAFISYGEEGSLYANGSLQVSGNTFLNDFGSNAVGVVNATSTTAQLSNNSFYGLSAGKVASGANSQTGDSFLSSEPYADTAWTTAMPSPWPVSSSSPSSSPSPSPAPAPAPAPTPTLSADGSTLLAGSGGSLVTTDGTWTFGTGTSTGGNDILLNGAWAAGGAATELLVDGGGHVFALALGNTWWEWTNSVWKQQSTSPLASVASPSPAPAPAPAPSPTPTHVLAEAAFEEISGGGTWSQNGNNYTLDLGGLAANSLVNIKLGVLNSVSGAADQLSGSFQSSGSGAFALSGFGAFSDLSAGQADTAPTVTLNTSSAGAVTETITLDSMSSNSSGYSGALPTETLTITGIVDAAPAPAPTPAPAPAPSPSPAPSSSTVGGGHWIDVANSHMASVVYNGPLASQIFGATGPSAIMNAWGGGTFDTNNDSLLVWGGGHHDYAGNEVYAFNVNTLQWTRLDNPSVPNTSGTGTYADGTPAAQHTYDNLAYIPTTNQMFTAIGQAIYPVGQDPYSWAYNLSSNTWTQKANVLATSSSPYGDISAYDPVTGHVWMEVVGGGGYLQEFDPTNNVWISHGKFSDPSIWTANPTGAIDPVDRLMVAVGNGAIYAWHLSSSSDIPYVIPTVSGDTTLQNSNGPGFVWDSAANVFVGWNGGTTIYTLDPKTWKWTAYSAAADNTVVPTAPQGNGTFGRFQYVPDKNEFILVNDINQDVYIYQPPAGFGSPSPAPAPTPAPAPAPSPTPHVLANPVLEEVSGGGTWSQSGSNYTLNLGTLTQGVSPAAIVLGVLNNVSGTADQLSGSFQESGSGAFTLAGFSAFSNLAAGQADTAPTVTLNTSTAGSFTETITLNSVSSNSSGYSGALPAEALTITGNVQAAAPSPAPAPSPAAAPTPVPTPSPANGVLFAPNLPQAIQSAQTGDIVSVQLQNNTSQAEGVREVTFGQAFVDGDLPAGAHLIALVNGQQIPVQMDVKTTNADGSVAYAIVTLQAPALAANSSVNVMLARGTPAASGPVISPSNFVANGYDGHLALTFSGGGTTSIDVGQALNQALANGTAQIWMQGSLATDVIFSVQVNPQMHAQFDVRQNADGTFLTDFSLWNDAGFQTAQTFTYSAQFTSHGTTQFSQSNIQQYPYSSWHQEVWSTSTGATLAPADFVAYDINYLERTGAVPALDTSTGVLASAIGSAGNTAILGNADVTQYMPMTGGRADIGPLTAWESNYLVSQSQQAEQVVLANANAAGSVPDHFADNSGQMLTIASDPNIWIDPSASGANSLATPYQEGIGGWWPDTAHMPDLSSIAYLITGDDYYLEQLQQQANYDVASVSPAHRGGNGSEGLFDFTQGEQTRAIAWSLRDVANAAYLTPDSDPLKAYFTQIENNNINDLVNTFVTGQAEAGQQFQGYINADGMAAPFEEDFLVTSLGQAERQGFTSATTMLNWEQNFVAGLFLNKANGFDPLRATQEWLSTVNSSGAPLTTWAQLYNTNLNTAYPLANATDPQSWFANARAATASLFSVSQSPTAMEAYAFIVSQTPNLVPNFQSQPQFDIVPILADGDPLLNSEVIYAPAGGGTVNATSPDSLLIGGPGSDTLNGGSGVSVLMGGGAELSSGGGIETLNGGTGTNYIYAGSGTDTLVANGGWNYMKAGAGADTFVFTAGGTVQNTVAGFKAGTDHIQIHDPSGTLTTTALLASAIASSNGGTVLNLGPHETVTIQGVAPNQLQAAWFTVGH